MSAPALRFKQEDGQNFPDWDYDFIGNLFIIKAGGDISSSNVSAIKDDTYKYPIYSNSEKNAGLFGYSNQFRISDESITVTGRGSLGIAIPRYEPYYPIVRLLSLIPKSEFNVYFGAMAVNQLDIFVESTGVPQLTAPQVSEYTISYPSLIEQTKIANFLTAVDEKITQLIKKHDLLTQYKKGVMQQIFSQKLRFKDDDGGDFPEWKTKRLLDLAKVYDGTHMTPDYKESGVPFFSVEHLTNNNFCDTKFISEEVFDKENQRVKLEKGDILMTRIGDIGTPKYINWDVRASFYVSLALIKQSKNINSQYLSHFIKTPYFQKELHQRTIHVAFPKKINLGEISECLVQFPSEPEQTKIASFLTAIDDKITATQTQLQAVKQYKQGLLQKMFV